MPWGKPGTRPFWGEGILLSRKSVGVGQNKYFKDSEALQQYRGEDGVCARSFWRSCEQRGLGGDSVSASLTAISIPVRGPCPCAARSCRSVTVTAFPALFPGGS